MTESTDRLVRVETTVIGLSEKIVRLETMTEDLRDDFNKVDNKLDNIAVAISDIKVNSSKNEASLGWMKKMLIIALVAALGGGSGIELAKILVDSDVAPTALAAPTAPMTSDIP